MTEQVVEIVQLYLGRGVRGEPFGEDKLEVSVNLTDLAVELEEAMLTYNARRDHVWLPLTTTVAGVPELVWGGDDALIPTHVPTPATAVENASPGAAAASETEGG